MEEKINAAFIKEIVAVAWKCPDSTLFGSLTIFAKDLSEFLAINAFNCKGVTCFYEIYNKTLNADRYFWKRCGSQLFQSIANSGLPNGFSEAAMAGDFEKIEFQKEETPEEPPTDEAPAKPVLQLWLSYPGWAMFKCFRDKYKPALCDATNGIFQQFDNGTITSQEELAEKLATELLKTEFTCNTFWYPFVVYMSVLMVKALPTPYCSTETDNCC